MLLDSVIFLEPGMPQLRTGSLLGELTDECAEYIDSSDPPDAPSPYISKFLSSGPKSYGLQIEIPARNTHKIVRKLKGFSLSCSNQQETGLDTLEDLITGRVVNVNVPLNDQIGRTKLFEVYTAPNQTKKLRLVFNKRRRINDYETVPFGTVDEAPEVQYKLSHSEDFDFRKWCA